MSALRDLAESLKLSGATEGHAAHYNAGIDALVDALEEATITVPTSPVGKCRTCGGDIMLDGDDYVHRAAGETHKAVSDRAADYEWRTLEEEAYGKQAQEQLAALRQAQQADPKTVDLRDWNGGHGRKGAR